MPNYEANANSKRQGGNIEEGIPMTNNHTTEAAYKILREAGMGECPALGSCTLLDPDSMGDQDRRTARDLLTMHALRWLRGLLWQANKVVFNISKCADGMMSVNIDTFCEQSGAWDNDGLGEGVDELDAIVEAALAMKEAKADG